MIQLKPSEKLLAHQQEALRAARGREAFAYLMDPRTGKTLTMLVELTELHRLGKVRVAVVVVPKGVARDDVWGQELRARFTGVGERVQLHTWRGGNTKWEEIELRTLLSAAAEKFLTILVIHWDALNTERGQKYVERLFLHWGSLTALVLDEAHRMKTPSAKRTRGMLRLRQLATYRRILTGSLVANSPLDVWAPFQFLDPGILRRPNFWGFKTRYAVLKRKRFGNGPAFNQVVGYQHLDELKERVAGHSYSVTVAECFDLPPRQYRRVPVDLGPEQERLYAQLRDEFIAEYEGQGMTAALALTRLLRLQQLLGGTFQPDAPESSPVALADVPRLEVLADLVAEAPGKVVVWAKFVPERQRIVNTLAPARNGDWRRLYTDLNVEGFRADEENSGAVLVASPEGPASEGVDLSCADTMIYYSNSFKLTARVQSEARCENLKLRRPVQIIDLFSPDTVDVNVLERLQQKGDVARTFSGKQLREWLR